MYTDISLTITGVFLISFLRDVKKLKESQEAEKAKAESRSKNLKFLENKSKDLKIRINDAEVCGRNFPARHCDGMTQLWLVEPRFVVTETFHKLPKLQDWGLLS